MIGIQGEVYPILRDKFDVRYNVIDGKYTEQAEYTPVVLNRVSGDRKELLPFARPCVPKDSKLVRAKPLEKDTKVFSYWDTEKYFYGDAGAFLVAGDDDYGDCYIVRRDIFHDSYEPVV
jgi:phosphoglycolate phosphatase